jgi:dynein heavy chain 2, cytosolic
VESEILIKAVRINTISKLTFNDMLKFNVLVEDVFPGTSIKDIIYEQVSSAIKTVFEEENFQILPNQLNKILQFYEATKQRIGAVLVGPSGCGKTTIWKALKKAYDKLKQPVKVHLINPKAMPRSSFLGCMNNDTREFS